MIWQMGQWHNNEVQSFYTVCLKDQQAAMLRAALQAVEGQEQLWHRLLRVAAYRRRADCLSGWPGWASESADGTMSGCAEWVACWVGCLGDQQAAMLGQRCRPLEAKNTYGTGCFVLLHTGAEPVDSEAGLLTTMVINPGPGTCPSIQHLRLALLSLC